MPGDAGDGDRGTLGLVGRACQGGAGRSVQAPRIGVLHWSSSPAHVIGRSWALEPLTRQVLTDDAPIPEVRGDPALIVPLCRLHHTVHQLRKLDLLDYLTAEEAQAVLDAGSLASARRRLRPP